jgi:FKBP-type peptidyl-prolyl cis-trans isomerase (trigger factor)
MPKNKKGSKSKSEALKKSSVSKPAEALPGKKKKRRLPLKLIIPLAILVIAFFILGLKVRGLVFSALINKKPITSWQFAKTLYQRYGSQVLEDLIFEELIAQEAQTNQIIVADEEIQEEIENIKEQLGGEDSFQSALEAQGISLEEFKKGARIQLTIQKLLEKRISITDREIDAFVQQYQGQMEATEEMLLREEAYDILKSEKMSEAYNNLFPELEEKANVLRFLKF